MSTVTRQKTLPHQHVRVIVQIAVVVLVTLLSLGHTRDWSWAAGIHTVCPFGGVANLYTYFTTGGFVAKLHEAVFVVLLALLAGLLLTGKSFCGWICPLGSIQEFLGRLGRRAWPRLFGRLPTRFDHVLRWAKWAVLLLVIIQTARTAKLFFQPYDPYYNLFSIWTDEIAWTGYLVVALTLAGSLFVERPFCRYACPLGALNGVFNSFSLLPLRRVASSCTDCGRCDRACPAGIEISRAQTVRSLECTRCLACVSACPVNKKGGSALAIQPAWRRLGGRRPVPAGAFFSVALLAFAAPLALTSLSGDFVTETQHVYESPDDIRGSSPLADIIQNYDISQQELYNGFGLPAELDPATKLKDVQNAMGLPEGAEIVVPEFVRAAVAALDRPLSALVQEGMIKEESLAGLAARQVQSADAGPVADATWTMREVMAQGLPGSAAYLLSGSWPTAEEVVAGDATAPSGEATSPDTSARPDGAAASSEAAEGGARSGEQSQDEGEPPAVRGATTLQEIQPLVADYPAFLAKFGIPADEPRSAQLKDLSRQYGFEVSAVREFMGAD